MTDSKTIEKDQNPFTKGSVYRVTSLGTHEQATVTHGEFVGFAHMGMGAEALVLLLGSQHGEEAGKKRVIPLHVVLHVDVHEQADAEEKAEEEHGHVYYS